MEQTEELAHSELTNAALEAADSIEALNRFLTMEAKPRIAAVQEETEKMNAHLKQLAAAPDTLKLDT